MVRIERKSQNVPAIVTPFRRAVGGAHNVRYAVADAGYEPVGRSGFSRQQCRLIIEMGCNSCRTPGVANLIGPIPELDGLERLKPERTRREGIVFIPDSDGSQLRFVRRKFKRQIEAR